ncbi:unnamed protein product [Prorocentrum cordatum]|uniref:Uncharacterized protein n=1 Tax=Prorocentrum cordatum TaxID=2364126 RepID=A0ABN9X8R1_9DINO|nr:unnamed protein product [Polarella glacialis]
MERFFPTLYSFQAEGAGAEERELFGPLVGATEAYVEELPLPECTVSFDSWQRPGGVSTVFLSDVLGRIEASRFSHAFVRPAGTTCVHIPRSLEIRRAPFARSTRRTGHGHKAAPQRLEVPPCPVRLGLVAPLPRERQQSGGQLAA